MLESFQERQALEMSHASHMHRTHPLVPLAALGTGSILVNDSCTGATTSAGSSGQPQQRS